MSEPTDLYYDRLASVATNAMTTAPEDAHPINIMTHAVAAQVLRDLLDHIGGMTIHDDVGGSESTDKMLRDFAAERGINFGEE